MKKICIIIPYNYPVPAILGGAIETLVQFLIEENEKKPLFHFTVLATYNQKLADAKLSYKYTKLLYYRQHKYLDAVWEFIYRAIKKVFHVYIPFSARFVSILKHLKLEGDNYDYVLFESGLTYMLPLVAKVYPKEKILNHIHWPGDGNEKIDKSFAYLLSVSQFCADRWKAVTNRKDDKIIILKNCCNDESFSKRLADDEKDKLRNDLGICANDHVILFVGRVIPDKGIRELLLALQKTRVNNIVLIIIGKANFGVDKTTVFETEVEKLIKKSRVKIIHKGFVQNADLHRYFEISDLSITPSIMEDPALIVNIEAMTSGTAVITTDRGGIKEYVGDAALVLDINNGFVEKLACSIDELLSDTARREEMVKKGLERAEKYTREQYFLNFSSAIEQIDCQRGNSPEN